MSVEARAADDQIAIRRAIASFIACYNAGDLAGVMACYDDDLIKVREGAAPESKPEIERRLKDVFDQFTTRVEVDNLETVGDGTIAYTRGTFLVTLTPRAGGESRRQARRYLEIWRKRDGRWLVARTMDNSE